VTQCERTAHELDRRSVELSLCWGSGRESEGLGQFPIRASRMGTSKLCARRSLTAGIVRAAIYLSDFKARFPATCQPLGLSEVFDDPGWVVFDPFGSCRSAGGADRPMSRHSAEMVMYCRWRTWSSPPIGNGTRQTHLGHARTDAMRLKQVRARRQLKPIAGAPKPLPC